jgi:hypothetical protein
MNLEVLIAFYTDEDLFFKDDDTHVFIETKNSVAIIKTINVQDDECPDNSFPNNTFPKNEVL